MRRIGLLGGMSWESTVEYYRLANRLVAQRRGGLHSARLLVASVDFAPVEELQRAGDWTSAGDLLAAEARALQAGGAELLVLCTNTMHIVADRIAAAVDVPFLHIGDVIGTAVAAAGVRRIGFLGTSFSMEQPFLLDRLRRHGLDVAVPAPADRAVVHRVIYDELCRGILREESRVAYRETIARLVDGGAEGIVLGCTEIELLISAGDSPVPLFPTTRLHVEAAVELALA